MVERTGFWRFRMWIREDDQKNVWFQSRYVYAGSLPVRIEAVKDDRPLAGQSTDSL